MNNRGQKGLGPRWGGAVTFHCKMKTWYEMLHRELRIWTDSLDC